MSSPVNAWKVTGAKTWISNAPIADVLIVWATSEVHGGKIRGFILEAIPLVLGGIFLISLLDVTGLTDFLSRMLAPVFRGLLGLPAEAAAPIFLGILRKDVALGMLGTLGLSPTQLVVATVTLAMTFPCIATFIVLWKELGGKRLLASLAIMIAAALTAGMAVRLVLSFSL